ncbi:hypothetical protein [Streptomyces sp. Ru71]|nr:hypothetical protein [Streptomyces sp. Ru71]
MLPYLAAHAGLTHDKVALEDAARLQTGDVPAVVGAVIRRTISVSATP